MNDENEFAPRLDMIETEWTMFRHAHETGVTGTEAKSTLVLRYATAIRSYVKAMTRSDTDADELSQDVIVRLLKGDFAGADPDRGRFRDLLKVAVKNMTRNHWSKENRRKGVDYDLSLEGGSDTTQEIDDQWSESWRDNVLDIVWARLQSQQDAKPGTILFSALRLRTDHPEADSTRLAELISQEHDREINAATYRQNLRRARVRFAEFVVEEVANGLDEPNPQRIQEELISIGLFEHIKDVLPENWSQ